MTQGRLAAAIAVALAPLGHAWAAGGGHGEHHAASPADLLFPVLNFAIFLFIVARFAVPPLREYLRQRQEDIVREANEAAGVLAEAEGALAAARGAAEGVAAEQEAIRADLRAGATHQAARARADAETNGARRVRDAELLAEQERRRALAEVRAEIAARATSLAEGRIRGALGADDQGRFVRQFLEDAAAR